MNSSSTRYLDKLASLRFFAAFLVLIFHMGRFPAHYDNAIQFAYTITSEYGFVGVSIFFVLSGIVISYANENWNGWKKYLIGRVTRIYPPHWIVTFTFAIITVIGLFTIEGWTVDSILKFFTNLLLIQAWVPDRRYFFSLNLVTWSLSVEIFFYISFILLRKFQDRYIYALSIVSYLILFFIVSMTHHSWNFGLHWELYINPIARLPEFLAGMAIYRLYRCGRLPKLWIPQFNFILLLGAMLTALAIAGAVSNMGTSFKESFTYSVLPLPFITLIMIALLDEKSNLFMHNKILVLLGESSFALYLTHRFIIHYVVSTFGNGIYKNGVVTSIFMVSTIMLAVCVSVLFYKFIEIPTTRYLRNYLTKRLI